MAKGFASLISVLVIGAIILAVGLSVSITSVQETQMSNIEKQGQQARALAESCAKIGINKLLTETDYEGSEEITLDDLTCQISSINDQKFTTSAEYKKSVARFEIEIDDIWQDLIGWWRLNDGDGCQVRDLGPEGNDGDLEPDCPNSGPKWSEDRENRFGRSLKFDGQDDHIIVNDLSSLAGRDQFTITWWAKHSDLKNEQYLFWAENNLLIEAGYSTSEEDSNDLRVRWHLDGQWGNEHVIDDFHPDNEWYHGAAVFDQGVTEIYRDGNLVYTGADEDEELTDNTPDLFFGRRETGQGLSGFLDDVRIYGQALGVGDINTIRAPVYRQQLKN